MLRLWDALRISYVCSDLLRFTESHWDLLTVSKNTDKTNKNFTFTATDSNWEFCSMNPMRTSTPSSGYNSTSSVSRASSFSSKRLASADDSAYSEVYSTIEELSELADPFDDPLPAPKNPESNNSKISHQKTASSTSTILASEHSTLRKCSTLPPKPAPPLPPRLAQCRPPARPPYPSSHVKQNSHWKIYLWWQL